MSHYDHKEKRTFFIFILIFLLLVMGIVTSLSLIHISLEIRPMILKGKIFQKFPKFVIVHNTGISYVERNG